MRNAEEMVLTAGDIDSAGDMLKAAVARVFVDFKITNRDFTAMHREFMIERLGETDNTKISSSRNNLLNAIQGKNTLTYTMFEFTLKNVLGLNLIGLTLEFRTRENKPYIVSTNRVTF